MLVTTAMAIVSGQHSGQVHRSRQLLSLDLLAEYCYLLLFVASSDKLLVIYE